MSHYNLIFSRAKDIDNEINLEDKTDFILSTNTNLRVTVKDANGKDVEKTVNKPNEDLGHKEFSFSLDELHFDRQLYTPCKVTSIVTVTDETKEYNLNALSSIFLNKTVEIRCTLKEEGLDTEIGRDYFVYNVKPNLSVSFGQKVCQVELTIYSRDFWLTTLKYSRAYLSRKLGEDIIKKTLSADGGVLSKYKVDFDVDNKRLRNTTFKIKKGENNYETRELIQPYHIQYNEDFHSFISRIAIRHGEYLFFENGKLTLGLDSDDKQAVKLDADNGKDKVLKMSLQASSHNPVNVNSYYKNYIYNEKFDEKKNEKGWSKTSNEAAGPAIKVEADKLYFNEDAFDEYFDVFSLKQESYPTSFGKQLPVGGLIVLFLTAIMPTFINLFKHTYLAGYDLIYKVGFEIAKILTQAKRKAVEINDTYVKFADIGLAYGSEQKEDDFLGQFATLNKNNNASNFMHTYYSAIRKCEEEMFEKIVSFQLSPARCGDIKLGAKVIYNEVEYFVTRIYGGKKAVKDGQDDIFIEAVPVITAEKQREADGTGEWKDYVEMLPPYNKCYEHPLATPQVAVVADNKDPRFLNRVRVRYPWQAKDEQPSVWLRVQTPFSTVNGGFHFVPVVGDEVIVNYEDGNADRPFVSGFFFNSECVPSNFPHYASREIRSEEGSRIVLGNSGGDLAAVLDSFVPVSSFVTPFLGPEIKALHNEAKRAVPSMFGNVTLTDSNGFFEISGDTAKRQVRLNSTIGKVRIDSLTGVEINAQLGDIKIKANNIDIEANNRINIVSGLSIKGALDTDAQEKRKERLLKGKSKFGAGVADYASSFVADMVKGKVDYSIIRGVWDAINPPKDGTLKLKSYRYMQLEAGNGDAVDNQGFQTKQSSGDRKFVELYKMCGHVVNKTFRSRLRKYHTLADKYISWADDAAMYKVFENKYKSFDDLIKFMGDNNFKILPKRNSFCTVQYEELDDSTTLDLIYRKRIKDNLNDIGNALCHALWELHGIYVSPFSSETFAKFIGKSGMGEELKGVISDSYVETRDRIHNIADFSRLIKMFKEEQDFRDGETKYFQKIWFRNIVYSFMVFDIADEKFRYFPVYSSNLPDLETSESNAEINDEDWMRIVDSLDSEDESLFEADPKSRKGTDVSRDQWGGVKDFYHRQIFSPSSIWGPEQEGRILISENAGKTMRLNKDHSEWKTQDNKFTVAVVSKFLKTK